MCVVSDRLVGIDATSHLSIVVRGIIVVMGAIILRALVNTYLLYREHKKKRAQTVAADAGRAPPTPAPAAAAVTAAQTTKVA